MARGARWLAGVLVDVLDGDADDLVTPADAETSSVLAASRRLGGGSPGTRLRVVVCGRCGTENKATARFCAECGSPLSRGCPACEAPVHAGQKFCDSCGTALVGESTTARATPQLAQSAGTDEFSPTLLTPVAERRVCSVLFCDLVGFTPLSESRDPEEVRELLSRYFDAARTVISRYGGVVEKFIGDAVMAVWGTPTATEEDGERAVRAALELIDAVAQLGQEQSVPDLAARAGVVTGSVAVTVGATGQGMVAGDAVNTAARVQAAAEPGTVLVDEATRRVAEAAIGFDSAGEHSLKGKAEPVPLWRATRVVAGAGGSQRIDGLEAGFVGRDAELRLIKELFHACDQRRAPRLVSVTGAAGVGKSRLGWEFRKYLDGLLATVWWHQGRCLSYGDGVAFWALAEMVRQRLGIAEEDSASAAADKLRTGLEQWLPNGDERSYVGPRLAQLLGVEYGEATAILGREELFAGWRLFFERLAATGPVVMVVEDLQHADAGLLDFLDHLLDWARDVPIFVLTLARPELESRRPGWGAGRRNSTTLSLDPLDEAAMHALLDGLVPGMPSTAKTAVADRAEGIPLYAVETVRMLVDRDVVQPIDGVYRLVGNVGELEVPATLQSLLAARLDTLEPNARRLVADAAVLGGTFPAEALVAVSDQPEADVRRLLAELVRREVLGVRADPLSPQRGQYAFVQTMFRQVAYDTLSRRERKARHLAVATHLRTAFADEGEEIAEVIAAHLLDALTAVPDDPDVPTLRTQTVAMLSRAGERATRAGAPTAAATAYSTAANQMEQEEGADGEIAAARLRELAGGALLNAEPQLAAEHYRRASGTYARHQRRRDAARADTGLARAVMRVGEQERAKELLRGALSVLEATVDADTVDALSALAMLEAFAGNHPVADQLSAAALAKAQALDLSDAIMSHVFKTRGDAHTFANRQAQAAANYREALRRAEAVEDSAALGVALLNLTNVLLTSDPRAATEIARAAVAHCRRVGSRYHLVVATSNLVHALITIGEWSAAESTYVETVASDARLADDPSFVWSTLLLRALQGDLDGLSQLLPVIDQWNDSGDPQDQSVNAACRAAAHAAYGEFPDSLAQGVRSLSFEAEISLASEPVWWGWSLASSAAIALDDFDEAARLLDWLDEHPPGHIPSGLRAERQRILARLLAHEQKPEAGPAYETAVQAFRKLGSPYHLAVCLLDQAEYLSTCGKLEAARDLVAEATTIVQRLGARPLIERATRLAGSRDDEADLSVAAVQP